MRAFAENNIPNRSWQHEILTAFIGDIALMSIKAIKSLQCNGFEKISFL
jgi:hypothetical protein